MSSGVQDSAKSDQAIKADQVGVVDQKAIAADDKKPLLEKTMDKSTGKLAIRQPITKGSKVESKQAPAFREYVDGLSGPKLGFVWITYASSHTLR